MLTLFFGSHNSHPSHPISALTVSSAHSILVPLAMVPSNSRAYRRWQIGNALAVVMARREGGSAADCLGRRLSVPGQTRGLQSSTVRFGCRSPFGTSLKPLERTEAAAPDCPPGP